MRHQFFEAVIGVRWQPLEHVAELRVRVLPVQLGRLQQVHHDRGPLAGEFAACEQPCAASHGTRTGLSFKVVVVHRHPAIARVVRERRPVLQAVVDRFGDRAAFGYPSPLALLPASPLQ